MSNRIIARLVWAAVAVIGLTNGALAQDYPSRPITMVVPYPAGGGADIIARLLADPMKQHLVSRSLSRTNRAAREPSGPQK
jgi:tripartite-type tricarboxylate transporter receptor subunit TctC